MCLLKHFQLFSRINALTRILTNYVFRSGSSLLGDLLSLHPSTSYYYEPFWQHELFDQCQHRFNSSEVVNLIEETLKGIMECEDQVVHNISKFSIRKNSLKCNETRISVIKTIRIHLNGIVPWLDKYPSLKVCGPSRALLYIFGAQGIQMWSVSQSVYKSTLIMI